jgi:peroxiredoxin
MTQTGPSTNRQLGPRIVGGHVLAAALALLAINLVVVSKNCRQLRSPAAGMAAPDFSLPSPSGKPVRLRHLRGQVVLLDFWASWCPPCRDKFPLLKKLQRELGPRGLRVLAVNTEGDPERAAQFARAHGLTHGPGQSPDTSIITLIDDGRAAGAYGVHTIPHVVVIGRDGKIAYLHIGTGGETEIQDRVRVALAAPRGPHA